MQLRVARHTERLDELVSFYRDGIGLTEVGGFRDHDGYDGVFLEMPGTSAHLELTAGGPPGAPEPHPESLLVLYLGDDEAVRAVAARLGREPVASANPYWAAHALTFEDPDGFRVALVPERWQRVVSPRVEFGWYSGDRERLRGLFELAESSVQRLEAALPRGRVLTAADGNEMVGCLQLVESDAEGELELLTLCVAERHQRRGIGSALVDRAIVECRAEGVRTLLVSTAAADAGNLRFYQRLGFRMRRIERDAFMPADGYPEGFAIDGVPLRDRVWFSIDL